MKNVEIKQAVLWFMTSEINGEFVSFALSETTTQTEADLFADALGHGNLKELYELEHLIDACSFSQFSRIGSEVRLLTLKPIGVFEL
ncbi:MAG: hypothetical protein ACRC1D_01945 [Culicoidibacterales bacterium]